MMRCRCDESALYIKLLEMESSEEEDEGADSEECEVCDGGCADMGKSSVGEELLVGCE